MIVQNESDISAFADYTPPAAAPPAQTPQSGIAPPSPPTPTPASTQPHAPTPISHPEHVSRGEKAPASPMARRMAAEKGIDLNVSSLYQLIIETRKKFLVEIKLLILQVRTFN